MPKQFLIRNPGCSFCRYYITPFKYEGEMTSGACNKRARIVSQRSESNKKTKWLWVDCAYSEEKNKDRYCNDFQIKSIVNQLLIQAQLYFKHAERQLPPAYSRNKWWKT